MEMEKEKTLALKYLNHISFNKGGMRRGMRVWEGERTAYLKKEGGSG